MIFCSSRGSSGWVICLSLSSHGLYRYTFLFPLSRMLCLVPVGLTSGSFCWHMASLWRAKLMMHMRMHTLPTRAAEPLTIWRPAYSTVKNASSRLGLSPALPFHALSCLHDCLCTLAPQVLLEPHSSACMMPQVTLGAQGSKVLEALCMAQRNCLAVAYSPSCSDATATADGGWHQKLQSGWLKAA